MSVLIRLDDMNYASGTLSVPDSSLCTKKLDGRGIQRVSKKTFELAELDAALASNLSSASDFEDEDNGRRDQGLVLDLKEDPPEPAEDKESSAGSAGTAAPHATPASAAAGGDDIYDKKKNPRHEDAASSTQQLPPSAQPVVHMHYTDGNGTYTTTVYGNLQGVPGVMQVGQHNNLVFYNNLPSQVRMTGNTNTDRRNDKSKTAPPTTSRQIVVPNRQVMPSDLQKVADEIKPGQWKKVGRFLDVKDSDMEAVNYDHIGNGIKEVIYQMLKLWSDGAGVDATVKTLAKALAATGRVDIVDKYLTVDSKQ